MLIIIRDQELICAERCRSWTVLGIDHLSMGRAWWVRVSCGHDARMPCMSSRCASDTSRAPAARRNGWLRLADALTVICFRHFLPLKLQRRATAVVTVIVTTTLLLSLKLFHFITSPRYFTCSSPLRAFLNPPKSTGTNRIEYYFPNESVLIGCRHGTDSMQPEKNNFPMLIGR